MSASVKLSGFRQLDQALAGMKKSTERALLRRVATSALELFVDRAKSLVPVDEGKLRDSIVIASGPLSKRAKRDVRDDPVEGVRLFAGTASRNAVAREFGSVRAPAQPYMRPAWDATAEPMLDKVKVELGRQIDRTAARVAKGGR